MRRVAAAAADAAVQHTYPLASPETRHAVGVAAAAASAAAVAHFEGTAPAASTPTRSTARGTARAAAGHTGVRKKR